MFANLEEDYSDKESDESDSSDKDTDDKDDKESDESDTLDKDTDDKDAPPKHLEAQVKLFTKNVQTCFSFFSLFMFHCRPTTQLGACM